jgi:hypothetical protein
MEDLDALSNDDLEGDFVNLVKQGFGPMMFKMSAEAMLGQDWIIDGEEILKTEAPELMEKFKKYVDQKPDTKNPSDHS